LFDRQDKSYRDEVLPPSVKARLAVEQAATIGWSHYTGLDGAVIGMHSFGASAPLKALLTKFGFTPEKIAEQAKTLAAACKKEI
jgi:transketolase